MSKTSKPGLTTPKKKPRRTAPRTRVECLDGLRDCLANLGTLAALLEATGGQPELLRPETVSHAGKLLAVETVRASAWLDQLEEPTRCLRADALHLQRSIS
jgi:hypothetical protein